MIGSLDDPPMLPEQVILETTSESSGEIPAPATRTTAAKDLNLQLEPIIVGGLTFFGTVLATAAGFWQWRRSQARESGNEYRAHRIEAMKEVWGALADLEEQLRTRIVEDAGDRQMVALQHMEHIARVNLLILRYSPFLIAEEQELVQRFMYRLIEINTMLRVGPQSGALDDASAMRRGDSGWWDSTLEQPPQASIVAHAANDLQRLRKELGSRYSALVRG